MELEDPYLMDFLNDITTIGSGFYYVIKTILGISYLCGKTLAQGFYGVTLTIWHFFQDASVVIQDLFVDILEMEKSLIRGAFLAYYGAGKIIEAFGTTLYDSGVFLCHFFESIGDIIVISFIKIAHYAQALTIIPDQIFVALALIGDAFIKCAFHVGQAVGDFCIQLVLAPVNVIQKSFDLFSYCVCHLVDFCFKIPPSAFIGLGIITSCYLLYCRLNLFLALRILQQCFTRGYHLLCKFLRVLSQKLLRIFKSTDARSFLRELSPVKSDQGRCVVCMESVVSYISMPCRHVCLCNRCVKQIIEVDNRCPMCRERVVQYDRVYLS